MTTQPGYQNPINPETNAAEWYQQVLANNRSGVVPSAENNYGYPSSPGEDIFQKVYGSNQVGGAAPAPVDNRSQQQTAYDTQWAQNNPNIWKPMQQPTGNQNLSNQDWMQQQKLQNPNISSFIQPGGGVGTPVPVTRPDATGYDWWKSAGFLSDPGGPAPSPGLSNQRQQFLAGGPGAQQQGQPGATQGGAQQLEPSAGFWPDGRRGLSGRTAAASVAVGTATLHRCVGRQLQDIDWSAGAGDQWGGE